MKRFLAIFAAVANLVLVDAVSKELAIGFLRGKASVAVLPGFFDLAYVENRGCAWGLCQGQVWPLAVFGAAALVFLIWKRKSVFGSGFVPGVAECLLYAGIVGNLIDRVFRGCVVDFLDFHWHGSHFPCFNVADAYITVAAGLIVLLTVVQKGK